VLDTDVVIGALDRHDAHHRKASAALLRMLEDGVPLYLCVVNYAEALVKPAEDTRTLQRAVDAIATLRIELHAPDAAIGRDAARLRHLNISLADGFALATARRLDAALASFDARVRAAARKAGLSLVGQT
jgi:predicted nucleic acid-binding protein